MTRWIGQVEQGAMAEPRRRAASIRDVARLAGVSHQTVSRVLNGHPSIREQTRTRVLDAMDQLGYRPNRAARALVTRRTHAIGILEAATGSYYGPASSRHAIEDAARAAGYSVTTAHPTTLDDEAVSDTLDHLTALGVEGLVVIAPQRRVVDAIARQRFQVPFVTMQTAGRLDDRSLWVDQLTGAHLAVRHLVENGHRSILHLAGPSDWLEAEARSRGYAEELVRAGLPELPPIAGDWTADSGYAAGRCLLERAEVTAVFSANDQMALGLMHALHDAGREVPADVSVVGFDDIPEAAHFRPPLTTVRQDFPELGRRCIRMLLSEIERRHGAEPTVESVHRITPELMVRDSVAAP